MATACFPIGISHVGAGHSSNGVSRVYPMGASMTRGPYGQVCLPSGISHIGAGHSRKGVPRVQWCIQWVHSRCEGCMTRPAFRVGYPISAQATRVRCLPANCASWATYAACRPYGYVLLSAGDVPYRSRVILCCIPAMLTSGSRSRGAVPGVPLALTLQCCSDYPSKVVGGRYWHS
ncbi:hypothetical protein OH77DRAFT_24051 [Trametes cingulata]|nr:hypothetical protein OH77DRAFT_24051 [Trametes cingulata]